MKKKQYTIEFAIIIMLLVVIIISQFFYVDFRMSDEIECKTIQKPFGNNVVDTGRNNENGQNVFVYTSVVETVVCSKKKINQK